MLQAPRRQVRCTRPRSGPPRRRRLARRTRQWNRLALDLRPSSLRAMLNVLRARCPCKHPFDSEKVCKLLSKLVDEVADLKVEFRDLKQQVLANLPSRGEYGLRQPRVDDVLPSIEQAPVVAEHTSPASKAESTTESARSLYNQVLQSVGSKRPFVRARPRVALCTLYISGFTIANMQAPYSWST